MVTLYLLLVDFVKIPFNLTAQEDGWSDTFVIKNGDDINIKVTEKIVSFYINDELIFTIDSQDVVVLKTGEYKIIKPDATYTLCHLAQ
jgi:hypothetical protein